MAEVFEHPAWWRWAFWVGSPLLALIAIAAPVIWYPIHPLAGIAALVVPALSLPPLWWTARNVPREMSVDADGVHAKPYFGRAITVPWSELEMIQTFDVRGWTNRRTTVVLHFSRSELAFFSDLDRFEELRHFVAGYGQSATAIPPWWNRLLKLGTL